MAKERLLVVEDDPKLQRLLRTQLAARDYEVCLAGSGSEALARVSEWKPDLLLLDITLPPGMDGISVCQKVRERSTIPIIMVTAADTPMTKMKALELGADDYMTKPFHTGELIARIRAVLRRVARVPEPASETLVIGSLSMDLESREVARNGESIALTRTEFALLKALASSPDCVLSYAHLLKEVWGEGYDDVRPLHVHICNLRRKLEGGPTEPRLLLSVPGVGYRLRSAETLAQT